MQGFPPGEGALRAVIRRERNRERCRGAHLALLTWNHASSVGVRAMDDQHAILMDTVNELRLALLRGSDGENAGEILYRLIEFTRMHFQSEECLMEQSRFPGLAEHRAAHQDMLTQLRQSPQRVLHGSAIQLRSLLGSLREGYLQHIETLDQQYGPWLNERGLR